MQRVDVRNSRGEEIACYEFGGTGQPALFVHGGGLNALSMRPFAQQLTSRFRCVGLDLRGHGASYRPDSMEWLGFADDVAAAVDALSLQQPVGIGHSAGATALLGAAATHPGLFARLYCYEPIVYLPKMTSRDPQQIADRTRRRHGTFASRDAALARLSERPPFSTFDRDALDGYLEGGLVEEQDGTVRLACWPEDEARLYESATGFDAARRLGLVECQTTIARGAQGEVMPASDVAIVVSYLRRGEAAEVPGLDHFGPFTDPPAVAEAVLRDLETAPT